MSAIEEAREQAREALAQWDAPGGNHSGQVIGFLASALRALLDATEPQETTSPAAETQLEAVTSAIEKVLDGQDALHCTRVWEACGYGTMSEEDFSPVANDAEAVHEIASAVLEALDATEPPPIKPAEDEREAYLPADLYNRLQEHLLSTGKRGSLFLSEEIKNLTGASALRKSVPGPRPITDEMVEAAAREYHERGNGEGSYARASEHVRTSLLFRMECALNAAEGARR